MSNKAISVGLFRVSSDGSYLDLIIDRSTDYNFSKFTLQVKKLQQGRYIITKYDLYEATFKDKTDTHYNFRIPLEVFGTVNAPAIYIANLEVVNVNNVDDIIEDTLVTSDVNFAYRCMLDDILKSAECCTPISDTAIRNYLLLYGHQAAMSVEDFDTAEQYYKLISQCFDSCGRDYRYGDSNCHTCNNPAPIPEHSCNCGK